MSFLDAHSLSQRDRQHPNIRLAIHSQETIKPAVTPAFFNPRVRSLARANVLVVGSVIMATLMSGFPRLRPTLWLIIPTLLAFIGTVDTLRNIQRRWSLYHGGVILCLYMDLMVISIVLFFLLYPYFLPLSGGIH